MLPSFSPSFRAWPCIKSGFSTLFHWLMRCSPRLSLLMLLCLLYFSLFDDSTIPSPRERPQKQHTPPQYDHGSFWSHQETHIHYGSHGSRYFEYQHPLTGITLLRSIFVLYTLFVHLMSLVFPIRALRSIRDLTTAMRDVDDSQTLGCEGVCRSVGPGSYFATRTVLNSETSPQQSDYDADDELPDNDTILHAILVPNYKEDIDTLMETLDVLASHRQARLCYEVYLAMEENETGSDQKAMNLRTKYTSSFHWIDYTVHPAHIPGEAAGKSSNLSWAAKKASHRYTKLGLENSVVVTVMDADTHLMSNYFSLVSKMHLENSTTCSSTIYVPPIVFDRNSNRVPRFVRMADILWCCAGLSGLHRSSTVAPPTSVYSLPLTLVDYVGGWDASPEAIGEDLHMYLKCLIKLQGNLHVQRVVSAASQTDVHSTGRTWIEYIRSSYGARYKQALRHMWGMLDTGYALRNISILLWYSIFSGSTRPSVPNDGGGFRESHISGSKSVGFRAGFCNYSVLITLMFRLYEAHFLPVHLTVMILASSLFPVVHTDAQMLPILAWTFTLTQYFRLLGYLLILCVFHSYMEFHSLCLQIRKQEMTVARLADQMYLNDGFAGRNRFDWVECLLFPIAGTLFGSIPAFHAQLAHFYTTRLEYAVSLKPGRKCDQLEDGLLS